MEAEERLKDVAPAEPAAPSPAAEAAPPPPEPATRDASKAPAPSPAMVAAEHINAHTMYSASQQTFQILAAGPRQTRASFQSRTWASVKNQHIVGDGVWRQPEYMLRQRRLLLLAGEPELGKATLALAIARRAVDDATPQELLVCRDLEETIVVALERWAKDGRYQRRVILLKDGFANDNVSLRQLGARLSREYLEDLTQILKAAGIYVILTSDLERVPTEWRALHEEVYFELDRPSDKELRGFLDTQITEYANRLQIGATHQLNLSDGQRQDVVARIRTIPGLARFRRNSFEALARKKLTLEQALEGANDLTRWFMRELRDREPAAWCLALAACLLEADPLVRSVPWAHVIVLADGLARQLETSIATWRRRAPSFIEPDETLLQRAGLELAEDQIDAGRGEHVRFSDESYPVRLWNVLARSGRGLLWTLAPLLETHAKDAKSRLRAGALVALGRAGASDGLGPLLHRVRVLASSDDLNDHVLLGRFLVGVAASGARACFNGCLDALRQRAYADEPRPWPFAIAMRELGLKDVAFAAAELAALAQHWARPRLADLAAIHRAIISVDVRRADADRARRASVEVAPITTQRRKAVLSVLVDRLLEGEPLEPLAASAYAVTGLCFGRNPAEVCTLFLPYLGRSTALSLSAGDPALGCVVAILFFDQSGVFSVLERYPDRVSDGAGREVEQSRVPVGLADDVSRIEPFAEFLDVTFDSLAVLPTPLAEPCQKRMLDYLKIWCRDGVRLAATRAGMLELLLRLRMHTNGALAVALTAMLKTDEEFRKVGSPLQALAREALTSTYQGRTRPGAA